jgi:aldehyde dehydrogenase (NAD+)
MSASTKVQSQAHKPDLPGEVDSLLAELGVARSRYKDGALKVHTPISGETIGQVQETSTSEAVAGIEAAHTAFRAWRLVPAPKRGKLVRLFGEETRANKEALGRLVSIEVGKIVSEGLGEVQEMIDICDFAVGLSRQLYGFTIATERAEHRMMESWHPLGVTGIISAFNFPVAVWAWNAAFALVCGNSIVWNPSVQLQSITELPPSKPDFRSTPRDRTSQTRPGTPASCQRGGAR